MKVPNGLKEIEEIFGKVPEDERERHFWELDNLAKLVLPKPIKYSYADFYINKILVHKLLYDKFNDLFNNILKEGIMDLVKDCGGSYNYRKKRNGKGLSTHSWGIAVDLNCIDNPFGLKPNQPKELVEVFEKYGFVWGGRWQVPDGMHFQFARGY